MTPPDSIANADSLLVHVVKDRRRFWTPSDLADLLTTSTGHIYELLDAGELEVHSFGKRRRGFRPDRAHRAEDLFSKEPRRACTRITRRSVIRYLIDSAEYDLGAEDLTLAIAKLAADLPDAALVTLEARFAEVRRKRAA